MAYLPAGSVASIVRPTPSGVAAASDVVASAAYVHTKASSGRSWLLAVVASPLKVMGASSSARAALGSLIVTVGPPPATVKVPMVSP